MASELSIDLREYLERCGLSESKIRQCSGSTRMYHDLGLYGDIAEARRRSEYLPLTLEMVDRVMRSKRWERGVAKP